ncbi:MAG TPA: exonuclease domain-containing protein [Myxococcaceae bacterium]|jgi:DNA polymerase III epsilon subunit-like protein
MSGPRLDALEVLVLDCQATGATPRHGHVIEIAWSRTAAALPGSLHHFLVSLPEGERVPRIVTQVTGLTTGELEGAPGPAEVWRALLKDIEGAGVPFPAVVHFATFEQRFLEDWHASHSPAGAPFPLELFCTHQLARRIFPGLPTRGLHALAGHLGLVLEDQRRAADHVRATTLVWKALVPRLAERGAHTLEDLRALLAAPAPKASRTDYPVQRQARLQAPDAPGVYRMRASSGELLYVGKATSLRRRVNSYFTRKWTGDGRKQEMLTMAATVEWTVTESVLEAAILESDQIKELAPRFNQALRARASEVWFAARSLSEARPAPGNGFALGPLPSPHALAPLPALRRLFAEGDVPEEVRRFALGLPGLRWLPEPAELAEGISRVRLRRRLGPAPTLAALLRAAATLWTEPDDDEGEDGDDEAFDWGSYWEDPENVARTLEDALRHAAHLLRRGRWFGQLRDAVVSWEQGERRRWLKLAAGKVADRGDARSLAEVPPPQPDPSPLDFAGYERLRIVTTELRTLLQRGSDAEVRVPGERPVPAARLLRRLAWV